MSVRSTSCCGLNEFYGFASHRTAKSVVKSILTDLGVGRYRTIESITPFILFTEVKEKGEDRGEKLARYIKENKLGSVVKTPTRINPNSDNKLHCFIWTINKKNLKEWIKKN